MNKIVVVFRVFVLVREILNKLLFDSGVKRVIKLKNRFNKEDI